MSYYLFKKEQLLEQAKYQYHSGGGKKKSAAKYYSKNREVLSENARKRYRNLSEKEKEAKITN